MDAAILIQQLQSDNASAERELHTTQKTLREVVEEYTHVEHENAALQKQSELLRSSFINTSRIFFGGIRVLWEEVSQGGAVSTGAHRSLQAALQHLDRTQRALVAAGLGDVAAAASIQDSEELMRAAVSATAEEQHSEEREMLVSALRELQAHAARLEGELGQARQAQAKSEADAEAARRLAAAGPSYVTVGLTKFDAPAVAALQAKVSALESTLNESASAARQVVATSSLRDAESRRAAMNIELESALRRATEGELRADALEQALGNAELGASKRESDLRTEMKGTVRGLETANGALSRSLAAVRLELDALQDKHSAQAGVIDMLRSELRKNDIALEKAGVTKTALAQRAAAALREVEGQVAQLTLAVADLQAQKRPGAVHRDADVGVRLL